MDIKHCSQRKINTTMSWLSENLHCIIYDLSNITLIINFLNSIEVPECK